MLVCSRGGARTSSLPLDPSNSLPSRTAWPGETWRDGPERDRILLVRNTLGDSCCARSCRCHFGPTSCSVRRRCHRSHVSCSKSLIHACNIQLLTLHALCQRRRLWDRSSRRPLARRTRRPPRPHRPRLGRRPRSLRRDPGALPFDGCRLCHPRLRRRGSRREIDALVQAHV